MQPDAEALIRALDLQPHPEGGFFRETFRGELRAGGLPPGVARSASTAIYYLLPGGTFSAFHRVLGADELWHHYVGDPLDLHLIADDGKHTTVILGGDIAGGQRPQAVVPAGTLQAAEARGGGFALCGCTVAPGFEFADLVMPPRAELLARFPRHAPIISRLTRG